MRIIAGSARGRKLNTLPGDNTRPTLDRTREALFNILQTRVFDARVLDLFAGSGALALEAMSRGAEYAVLCDKSPQACKVITQNIEFVRVKDKTQLMQCEAQTAVQGLAGQKFDLIFLDPPYKCGLIDEALQGIAQFDLLADGGLITAETAVDEGFDVPDGFTIKNVRKYGKSLLHFIERV